MIKKFINLIVTVLLFLLAIKYHELFCFTDFSEEHIAAEVVPQPVQSGTFHARREVQTEPLQFST